MTPTTTNHAEIPTPETDELLEGREHGNAIEFLARSLEKRLHQATAQLADWQACGDAIMLEAVGRKAPLSDSDVIGEIVSLRTQLSALEECNRGLRAAANNLLDTPTALRSTNEEEIADDHARRRAMREALAQTPAPASVSDDLAALRKESKRNHDAFCAETLVTDGLLRKIAKLEGRDQPPFTPCEICSPSFSCVHNGRCEFPAARTQEKHP